MFFGVIILAATLFMLVVGVCVIDQLVLSLNSRIIELEADRVAGVVDDYQKALDDSGLAGLESYRKSLENELAAKFRSFHFEQSGALFMRSPSGVEISNIKRGGGRALWSAVAAKGGLEGVFEYRDSDSKVWRIGAFKSARNGWKVAISIDRAELFAKRDLYFQLVLIAGVAVLCGALGAAYYFAKHLSGQINGILDVVRRVAKGDLYARIDIKPFCDEYRGLEDGINSMIDNLRIRDIERERAEEESRKHQKMESIAVLAGGIAHDFNNLLTAIRGNLQLAQMFNTSPDAKQCMADCEKAAVRAMDLTRQLLTFSKGGAPVKSVASIAELIENNGTFVLRGTKSKCEFDFAEELKPVDIDPGQIGQAIDNLVINANQAMPDGGIVRIRAENIVIAAKTPLPLAPGEYVKISISDQGTGISKANLEKIFDPFFTTKATGSGLGLSTTYAIIKKHGGHIAVDSELGVGTIFFIYLPASQGVLKSSAGAEDGKYSGGGKVLIMDDQESIRNLLGKMLSIMNCECEYAEDGAKAIEKYNAAKAAGKPFDIVFMDLTIPGGMGGKEAAANLIRIDPAAVIVVASGYSNDAVMADYKAFGFSGRLDKPFRMQDLAKLMSVLMKGRSPVKAKRSNPRISKNSISSAKGLARQYPGAASSAKGIPRRSPPDGAPPPPPPAALP